MKGLFYISQRSYATQRAHGARFWEYGGESKVAPNMNPFCLHTPHWLIGDWWLYIYIYISHQSPMILLWLKRLSLHISQPVLASRLLCNLFSPHSSLLTLFPMLYPTYSILMFKCYLWLPSLGGSTSFPDIFDQWLIFHVTADGDKWNNAITTKNAAYLPPHPIPVIILTYSHSCLCAHNARGRSLRLLWAAWELESLKWRKIAY